MFIRNLSLKKDYIKEDNNIKFKLFEVFLWESIYILVGIKFNIRIINLKVFF